MQRHPAALTFIIISFCNINRNYAVEVPGHYWRRRYADLRIREKVPSKPRIDI